MRNEILASSNFQVLPPSCYEAWKLPERFLRLQGRMLGERICQQQDRYTRILINQFCFRSQSWTLKTLSIWWDEGGTLEQETLINLITLQLKPFEGREDGAGRERLLHCLQGKVGDQPWEGLREQCAPAPHRPATRQPPFLYQGCPLPSGLARAPGLQRKSWGHNWVRGRAAFFSYNWSRVNSTVSKAVVVGGMVAPKTGFALYIFLHYCCIFKFGSNMLLNSVC